MEAFEYSGWWWLPKSNVGTENPVAGILSFSVEEGLQLQLFGLLESEEKSTRLVLPDFAATYDLIRGKITVHNQVASLTHCHIIQSDIDIFEPRKSVIALRCSFAYIGNAWLDEPAEEFNQISLGFSHLLDWSGRFTFPTDTKWDSDGRATFQTRYDYPKPLAALTPEYQIRLVHGLKTDLSSSGMALQESVNLDIECVDSMSTTAWLSQYVTPLQNLLSLAVDRPVSLNRFNVMVDLDTSGNEENSKRLDRGRLRTVFQPISYVEEKQQLHKDDVLFQLADIEIELDQLLSRWFAVHEKYSTVCNLYFGERQRPRPFLSGRFLVLAQAVEIFHRIKFADTALPGEEFRRRRDEIVESAPESYQEWLKMQLTWSNELSLKQRIEKLYDHTMLTMCKLVNDPEVFVKRVRDTRNYYTHFGSRLRTKAAEGEELHFLTEALRYMLGACLLLELGFPSERVEELFSRNRHFQFVRERISNLSYGW